MRFTTKKLAGIVFFFIVFCLIQILFFYDIRAAVLYMSIHFYDEIKASSNCEIVNLDQSIDWESTGKDAYQEIMNNKKLGSAFKKILKQCMRLNRISLQEIKIMLVSLKNHSGEASFPLLLSERVYLDQALKDDTPEYLISLLNHELSHIKLSKGMLFKAFQHSLDEEVLCEFLAYKMTNRMLPNNFQRFAETRLAIESGLDLSYVPRFYTKVKTYEELLTKNQQHFGDKRGAYVTGIIAFFLLKGDQAALIDESYKSKSVMPLKIAINLALKNDGMENIRG